jgi:putative phosphoesterase
MAKIRFEQKDDQRGTLIGVISDTHGLVRPEALQLLRGSDLIIHAGDIGSSAVLDSLAAIAPLIAVRGNVDGSWAADIPETAIVEVGDAMLYVLHNIGRLDLKPEISGFAAVIYGHSHKPLHEVRNGVHYFNPGSAGPKRFKLATSVGKLTVRDGTLSGEIVGLNV